MKTSSTRSAADRSLGMQMAQAIATHDATALQALFSTPVTFRGVTPRRFWDAETAVDVADIALGNWFGPEKTVTGILSIETDTVGNVQMISYWMAVDLPAGPSVIEQVAYYPERDGQITHMRLVCSGFCPA
jgi:hypothetical protein